MIDYADLDRLANPKGELRPLLSAMFEKNHWLLKPMLEYLEPAMLPDYVRDVERIWSILRAIRPIDPAQRLDEVIRGLQFHSLEFLRLQIQFAKKGQYKSESFEKVYQEVYSSGQVMQQYLDGLLLTYVAWPNHYQLLQFYRRSYLAQAPRGDCLEIGPGHGWLALEQLESDPTNTFLGLDVSPHSVAYTRSVLTSAGIAPNRFQLREGDALELLNGSSGTFDRIVIAEVLEHLERPDAILKLLAAHAGAETLCFVTTVVNIEAVDHIYLFRELSEVRDMLNRCGLEVVDELDMSLKMSLKMEREAFEVALVCRRRANWVGDRA